MHKGALALAATSMVAVLAFPQSPSQAEQGGLEAAGITDPLTASAAASADFSRSGLSSKAAPEDEQEGKGSVKSASSGSVENISASKEADKPEPKPEPAPEPEGLQAPLDSLDPTSSFGYRTSPISGASGEFHSGQDYSGTCGTAVQSSASGEVTEAGWHPYGGGNRVTVDHGDGMETTYNHMSSIDVNIGQTVGAGDLVGNVGSTGASTGCHLHFEVVLDGEPVDPLSYL